MQYYLVSSPETIVSVVTVGKLPQSFFKIGQSKQMKCFSDIDSYLIDVAKCTQPFLIVLDIPESTYLTSSAFIDLEEEKPNSIVIEQIKPEWISKILADSTASLKLLQILFNNKCHKEILICPDAFNPKKVNSQNLDVVKEDQTRGIVFKQGDLLKSNAQTIINTVNCVGVMGKGIALSFKKCYPEMFENYQMRCKKKEVKLGEPYLYKNSSFRWILNFPTKGHWKEQSKLANIEQGLIFLSKKVTEWGIKSLAIPPLGCGCGGLNWSEVLPLIKKHLMPLGIPLEIYEPLPAPKAVKTKRYEIEAPLLKETSLLYSPSTYSLPICSSFSNYSTTLQKPTCSVVDNAPLEDDTQKWLDGLSQEEIDCFFAFDDSPNSNEIILSYPKITDAVELKDEIDDMIVVSKFAKITKTNLKIK